MTAALPSDYCFDSGDFWPLVNFRRKKTDEPAAGGVVLTTRIALELIFDELKNEADRPIRDRLNEALRQWHWRHHPKPVH